MGQVRHRSAMAMGFEYQTIWSEGEVTFAPFLRLDQFDSNRSRFDIRQLSWRGQFGAWTFGLGIDKVFWGVAESRHLVDIINQTDGVEALDGEEKLGQPMVNISYAGKWGIFDVYILPGFRQRTFPGLDGRLGIPLVINTGDARYESSAAERRTDLAVRWAHQIGNLEFGLAHFSGTSRDPLFQLGTSINNLGQVTLAELIPRYDVIDQTSVDAQYLFGDWAWKLEAITRSGQGDRYRAAVLGFEKTMVGVLGSRADLGFIAEYLYDGRGDEATVMGEDDLTLGLRLSLNNPAGATGLLAVVMDRDSNEIFTTVETSMRLGDHWKFVFEANIFSGGSGLSRGEALDIPLVLQRLDEGHQDLLFLQGEDFFKIELVRYW